jgi:type II secretory pathway pseudopilin PulG
MSLMQNRQRGFAVTTAMFILAVAGVAMAVVGALLVADVNRTLANAADAQLRQLLIAAEIDAQFHLSEPGQMKWRHALPNSLSGAKVETQKLSVAGRLRLRASASIGGRTMVEALEYNQSSNGWRLVGTELWASKTTH